MGLDLIPVAALPESDFQIEPTGTMIGRYRLLEQIGEGGFGIVYMAEQQEPVQRKVALKIIKPGMDTREVIARFEAERQALALMDHPNIACVLDAGATAAGRPYFVMELVRGIPITEYCDQTRLSTRERLQLFVKVCQAVQHAHQKGVIHRDIKPSNVLVTLHDGEPVPKVIDFGVAKALGQRLTSKTLFTGFHEMIGTPAYMSPEQAALSGIDVDTRADIYSLGVLLYELLTGVTPFDAGTFREVAMDEVRRLIRETDPPRPSTRLQTLGEQLRSVAIHRQTEAPKLVHQVRGDLDWVVMKCLEKDRSRRYETANGLRMDVMRYLNCAPVAARPPSQLYRLQKLVRRHKLVFAATGAVATSLVIGLGIATWGFFREKEARRISEGIQRQVEIGRRLAEKERDRAEKEAAKSRQTAQLLEDMLKGIGPKVAMGRDTLLLREILDNATEKTASNLKDQPEVAAELLSTIGATYFQLFDLGKAEAAYREALTLRKSVLGETNALVARSLNDLARVLILRRGVGEISQAETMARQALSILEHLPGQETEQIVLSWYILGNALHSQRRQGEAETAFRESLARRRGLFGDSSTTLSSPPGDFEWILDGQGASQQAEQAVCEAIQVITESYVNWLPSEARLLHDLATVLRAEGKLVEGEAKDLEASEQARMAATKAFKEVEAGDAVSFDNLAWILATSPYPESRDGASAVIFAEKAVAATNRKNPSYLDTLAAAYAETLQFTNAVAVQQEAIALLQDEELKKDYKFRLALYEASRAFREGLSLTPLHLRPASSSRR
jgi:tetratricopeptide (TPR) repeat protein